MSHAFYFALYTGWAIIWAHVLIYYAAFAYREWRGQGGTWAHVPAELAGLVRFTFGPLISDCYAVVRHRALPADEYEYRYQKAHRIAFFIAMAAIGYLVLALRRAFFPDLTRWSTGYELATIFLIVATSVAGLGHLFTALEHQPRRWRWFVAVVVLWYPLSMAAYSSF